MALRVSVRSSIAPDSWFLRSGYTRNRSLSGEWMRLRRRFRIRSSEAELYWRKALKKRRVEAAQNKLSTTPFHGQVP